jgi:hypothetical protein
VESKNNKSVITPAAIRPKALSPCIVHALQGEPVYYCEENMGFTKLDQGIVDSSVWSEELATRVVWITILAKSNFEGFVAASRSGLMRASNVTEEQFNSAIEKLESPDPDSRTPDYEGRRIKKIEGGWKVLNFLKYRQYTYSDSPEALKKRKQRKGTSGDMSPLGGDISVSVSESVSALKDKEKIQEEEKETQYNQGGKNEEVEKTAKRGSRAKQIPPELEWVKEYCLERKNHVDADRFFDYYEARGWIPNNSKRLLKNWQAAVRHWERSEYRAPEPAFHGVMDGRSPIEVEP